MSGVFTINTIIRIDQVVSYKIYKGEVWTKILSTEIDC